MRARDQSSIFSTGGKFRSDYGLLLELHTLTLVTRSYALLMHKPDSSTMPRPETIISTNVLVMRLLYLPSLFVNNS